MEFKIPEDKRGAELSAYLVEKLDEIIDQAFSQDIDAVNEFITLWSSNLRLHDYSINNIILAWTQYPELSMLCGFKKWLSLGRTVRKGEKAIRILAPIMHKFKDMGTSIL